MGTPHFGVSYWIDRLPRRRPSYTRYRGQTDVGVAIIGGGMAGCATAYALSTAGVRVCLFEADRIGQGAVGISTRGRDTGDAQIFINLVDNPRLDHNFTVFAQVITGMDTVDAILEGDAIDRIEIIER